MRLKGIIKGYELLKQRAFEEYNRKDYDKALKTLKNASSLAVQFNWRFSDYEFEQLIDDISKQYIHEERENLVVDNDKYVLIDDFCRSFILAIQYLDAFKEMGKKVSYIVTSSDIAFNSSKSILRRVRTYDNVEVHILNDELDDCQKAKEIWDLIVKFAPSKIFLHTHELSPCLPALYRLPKVITKYIINLSDQRFWLGCKAIDYSIEFRPFGATVSHEKRGLKKEQLLYVPFYPIVDRKTFMGFPTIEKDKVVIFSGGDFYKTVSPQKEYWKIVKRILDENPSAVILFAIKSTLGKADIFVKSFIKENHFENRFISIGFRDDINEVFAHSDIYLGTCPTSGSLMSQLAAWNKKPILQYYLPGTPDDETEQAICYNDSFQISFNDIDLLLDEAKKLITNKEYREMQGNRIFNAMIKPDQFVRLLEKELMSDEPTRLNHESIDYDKITDRWYWLEKEGFIDAGSNILGIIGKTDAKKYMPFEYWNKKIKSTMLHMYNSKFFTKEYYLRKFVWKFFPEQRYWYQTKKNYNIMMGKKLIYKQPKDLNEKLMWLTRYWRDPIKTVCADKYLVRDYVSKSGYEDILVPLLNVYDNIGEIDFGSLPDQFVLKCNHGSGCNIICTDKSELDFDAAKSKLQKWMNTDYSELMCEIHYKNIPRKIVCEQLLSDTAPVEYQFWCLNGQPESILACRKNFNGTYDAVSYSLEWERLYDRLEEPENNIFHRPQNLEKLISIAENLSKPFPFVRCDFYEVDGRVFFAELTFTPAGNCIHTYKQEFLDRLGEKLVLKKKIINMYDNYISRFVADMNKKAK